ncbi:MAG: hypothetical protein IJM17_09065 [Firmicutes bacterium]|nr:hypothetical protein [Bacillota bacterium]
MKEIVITLREWQKAALYSLLCAAASAAVIAAGMKLGVLPLVVRLGSFIFCGRRLWLLCGSVFILGCGWVLIMLGLKRDFRTKTAFAIFLPLLPFAYSRYALMTNGPLSLGILAVYVTAYPLAVSAFQIRDILRDDSLMQCTRNAWTVEELLDLVHRDLLQGPVYYSLTVITVMLFMPDMMRFVLFAEASMLGGAASLPALTVI